MRTSYLLKSICNILFLSFISISSFAMDIYVSPAGSDSNKGTPEKPFATIERAKRAVIKSLQNNKNEDCTVWIAEGVYNIISPVVFNASEFGNLDTKITFKAFSEETPVISGGIELSGWNKNKDGLWVTQLPKNENWKSRELFINGKRAIRARHPNTNYLRVRKVGKDRRTNFFFEKGDFPIPENVNGTELILLHDWSISRIGVKDIDSRKNRLTAVDSIGAKSPEFFNLDHWEKNPRYFLENAIEFLDVDY